MEFSFIIKYDKEISHDVMFSLGDEKIYPLSFSITPGELNLFLNTRYLFLSQNKLARSYSPTLDIDSNHDVVVNKEKKLKRKYDKKPVCVNKNVNLEKINIANPYLLNITVAKNRGYENLNIISNIDLKNRYDKTLNVNEIVILKNKYPNVLELNRDLYLKEMFPKTLKLNKDFTVGHYKNFSFNDQISLRDRDKFNKLNMNKDVILKNKFSNSLIVSDSIRLKDTVKNKILITESNILFKYYKTANIDDSISLDNKSIDVLRFDSVVLKNEFNDKYKTLINEYISAKVSNNNLLKDNFSKYLKNSNPNIIKNSDIIFKIDNRNILQDTKYNSLYREKSNIFKFDIKNLSIRNRNADFEDFYLLKVTSPNLLKHEDMNIKGRLDNHTYINDMWNMYDVNDRILSELNDGIDIKTSNKTIQNLNKVISIGKSDSGLRSIDEIISIELKYRLLDISNNTSLIKDSNDLYYNYTSILTNKTSKDVYKNADGKLVNKYNTTNISDTDMLVDSKEPYKRLLFSDEVLIDKLTKPIVIDSIVLLKPKDYYKSINLDNNDILINRYNEVNISDQVFANRSDYDKKINLNSLILLNTSSFDVNYYYSGITSILKDKKIDINNSIKSVYEKASSINVDDNLYINKYAHGFITDEDLQLYRPKVKTFINKDYLNMHQNEHSMIYNNDFSIEKDNKSTILNAHMYLYRTKPNITIDDTFTGTYKAHKGTILNNNVLLKYYGKKGILINESTSVDLYGKPIIVDDNMSVAKGSEGVCLADNISARLCDIGIYLFGNMSAVLDGKAIEKGFSNLSVSDYGKGIYLNKDLYVNKAMFNGKFLDNFTIDKNVKHFFFLYNDTWISKNRHDSSIIYENLFTNKNMHHGQFQYENVFVDKYMHHGQLQYEDLFVDKNANGTNMVDNLFISKNSNGINFSDTLTINKDSIGVLDNQYILNISNSSKGTHLVENVSVDLNDKSIDLSNSYIPIDFDDYAIVITGNESARTDSKGIEENGNLGTRIKEKGLFESNAINLYQPINKTLLNEYCDFVNMTRNLGDIQDDGGVLVKKGLKDTNLFLVGEFVTVIPHFGPDKPDLENTGNIDELILPHKDYKYVDFLKKLLFEDGSINWTYVKKYDPNTGEYTIAMPIENPITMYADVGRDYVDVDTAVLKLVIYIIRTIWQDNMYRYCSMSAQDSLNDIMVQLDTQLHNGTHYDLNKQKKVEAVRCMQLFRWYSEMAILNNCEYVLKFDTEKVAVDYYNKDLGKLDGMIKFENMAISDQYIIEPINELDTSGIIFTNNNIINPGSALNLSFKLYNINTESSISIIEDGKTSSKDYGPGVYDISLKFKEMVVLKCVPTGSYQSINVANIAIDNMSMRGFTTIYKGTFGETNKVMQDLLDRMLVVGEASDDMKDKLKDVSPVTVAINKMMEYFELHHENKLKGKRLITKK